MGEVGVVNKESIFVIGFPKSGNTWLARILAEATQSRMEATNVVDGADNSSDRRGRYLICKRHDSVNTFLPQRACIVYIIRDIRDVLVSAFFFNNRFIHEDWVKLDGTTGGATRLLYRLYFWNQVRRMNKQWCGNEFSVIVNWIHGRKSTVGSWSDHVTSWAKKPNVIVVRYEDLLQDTEGEIKRILGLLEIDVTDKTLKETISNQSFKSKKSKFLRSGDSINIKFLRSGKSQGWRDFLSPAMVKNIEKTHAEVMIKFGYKL